MDTLSFLKTILPASGIKFIAQWVKKDGIPKGGYYIHEGFGEIDEMADRIAALAEEGRTVYHACASYKEILYKKTPGGFQYPVGRTQDNAKAARALWIDFDVKPGNPTAYESKNEAYDALRGFVAKVGLPKPLLIDSGNGLHAYFLMDESLERDAWEDLAWSLKEILEHTGVKYDRSRTGDIASILRPVGSFNRKDADNPKPVKARVQGVSMPASHYRQVFDAYREANDVLPMARQKQDFAGLNSDLCSTPDYPDSFAEEIVKKCNQLADFKNTGGRDEPTWYNALGLLKHCKDGIEKAHEWSSAHADYDREDTDSKLEHWEYGPTSCERFRQVNPDACGGCEYKCSSPISLGYRMPENVEHTPLVIEPDETPQEDLKVGPGSAYWPEGYRVSNGRIEVARTSEPDDLGNTVTSYVPLLEPVFWLLNEARNEEGEYLLHMRAEIKEGKYHDFDIPTSATSSPDKLRSALSANRVHALTHSQKAGTEMQNFVIKSSLEMMRKRDEINTHIQMGWNKAHSSFLIGNKLVHANGVTTVRVGQSVSSLAANGKGFEDPLAPRGTLEEYRDGVKALYNHPDYEPYHYVLGAAIGAYVTKLVRFDEWHGIPLLVFSNDSGYGKTTVAAIGLNAVSHNSLSRATDGTTNFFKSMLKGFGSYPVFLDEVSKQFDDAKALQDFLYIWPTGQDRGRLNQGGAIKAMGPSWNNMGIITSNKSMLQALATIHEVTPEATQVRVLELDLGSTVRKKPNAVEFKPLAEHMVGNVYGVCGERLIRMILKNQDKIADQIDKEYKAVNSALPHQFIGASRFLCYHAACSLVGLKLGEKLGLWNFDVAAVREFITKHIRRQMERITEYKVSPEDRFAAMMADFHGKLLVTYRYDSLDARRKNASLEEPLSKIHGTVVGRYAIGCPGTKTEAADPGRLYITISAINKWCHENKLSSAEMRRDWMKAGLIEVSRGADDHGEKIVKVGRGVIGQALPQARCLEFVVSKVRDAMPEIDEVTRGTLVPINKSQDQSQAAA